MRFAGSSVRRIGKWPGRKLPGQKSVVFMALFGLVWIAPAPGQIESAALSAHELTAYRSERDASEYPQEKVETGEVENWSESRENFVEDSGFSTSAVSTESTAYVEGTQYPEPENLELASGESGYFEPGYFEPEYGQSEYDEPGYFEPEYSQSEYDESEELKPEYDESIAQLGYETDEENATHAENEVASSENPGNNSVPPPEPTEWIAAWVDDLKQSSQHWIEVDLSNQQILAWEGDTVVFSAPVSTGREGDWTPPGVYAIEIKYDKAWMQGDDYDIPNVPYVMYFFGSYAIHGAYWRDSFGTPASRGCVSMSVDQAAWLYAWATEGTHVVIER